VSILVVIWTIPCIGRLPGGLLMQSADEMRWPPHPWSPDAASNHQRYFLATEKTFGVDVFLVAHRAGKSIMRHSRCSCFVAATIARLP